MSYALHIGKEDFWSQEGGQCRVEADKRSNKEVDMVKIQLYTGIDCYNVA